MNRRDRIDRRSYLSALTLGGGVTVAGCLGALDAPEGANANDESGNSPSGDGTTDEQMPLDEDSQTATRFINEAKRDASGLSTWQNYRSFWVDALSQASAVQQESPAALNRIFQNSLENIPDGMHTVLFFELATTDILATTNSEFEGMVLEDTETPWIPEKLSFEDETQVRISAPYRHDGVPVVAFITKVRNRAGAALAALARTQPAVTAKDGGRFSTVVDGSGTIIIDSRNVDFVGQKYGEGGSERAVERGTAGDSGILNSVPIAEELDGDHVAAFAPVDDLNWTVILHAPTATVLDQSAEN